MFFSKPLSLCTMFIDNLSVSLQTIGGNKLSRTQKLWFSICLTGILVTNSVCWKKFERSGFGKFTSNSLSKMFRKNKISWDMILMASILNIFNQYEITNGTLALDGTDNKRSKNTKKIAKVSSIKDKTSGGFIRGQELTILVLITDKVTIPVGFKFHETDPVLKDWNKSEKELKEKGVAKKDRPIKPKKNKDYPDALEIALNLLKVFKQNHPEIKIKAILADALYGANRFVSQASKIYKKTQIITQAKTNQKVKSFGKYISIKDYFIKNPGVPKKLKIRGGEEQTVTMHGARLFLKAHGIKRYIIALKYEGESEYRYLLASELTWRLTDIAAAYTLRWLVEVFIQDWKGYEGWCQLAKQPGIDGSCRGVILSLLLDHCLLLHPSQIALIKSKLPASTVGSLRDRERANAILETIETLVADKNTSIVNELKDCISKVIPLRQSSKHMSGRELGRLEPTDSLIKYQKAA